MAEQAADSVKNTSPPCSAVTPRVVKDRPSVLREVAPGVEVDDVVAATGAPLTVADDVRAMTLPAGV